MAASRPLLRRSRPGPGSGSAAPRAGRVPTWIPIGVLATAAAWLCSSLQNSVDAAGFATVDVRRSRLDAPAGFRDPRWQEYLAVRLASLPPVDARDHAQVRSVAVAVAGLPFVQEVLEPRVLWPDGIEVPLRLRKPGACVLSGTDFLAISEDGVVLPGRWPTPPLVDGRFLPVIGPNDGRFDSAQPGERLRAPGDVDGLAVALSLRAALEPEDFALAGPPLVDATRARQTAVDEPGVRILFEGRRVVYFGRAPEAGAPGELPTEKKWEHVRRALAFLRPENGARDWSLADVRWDVADVAWRLPPDPEAPADAPTPKRPAPRKP
ncbi:MAG: hypothetical protein NTY35_12505 [Planctomycetota bacterium]|nr:hypothetical protein [Planctomycetota bacterium]